MSSTFAEDTLPPELVRALRGEGALRIADWGAATRRGASRRANEDAHGERDRRAFVVADGMGGRPGGALAASVTVEELLGALGTPGRAVDWRQVVDRTNQAVRTAAERAGFDRVGAAVAALRVAAGRATVVHLGDVRAYRLGTDGAVQLTTDHNVAQELVRAHLDPARLRLHPSELAALTVFLGDPDSASGFGVRSVAVAPGDRLVLCTDGVHARLGPDAWHAAARLASPAHVAAALTDAAIAAGSTDDATALVVAFAGPGRHADVPDPAVDDDDDDGDEGAR